MDELLSEIKLPGAQGMPGEKEAFSICTLLEEHKAIDVIALDLRELFLWTDFFIIATVSSETHQEGLLRHIKDYAVKEGLIIQRRTKREESGGWNLIDMGTMIIHLMNAPSRDFYELEKLWSSAKKIYPA